MEVIGNSIEVKSKVKKRRYFKNIDLILRLISWRFKIICITSGYQCKKVKA